MFDRPIYQTTVALLTLAAFAGGVWILLAPQDPPGFEITASSVTPQASTAEPGLLDINAASASELESLPGIGPVLAERIVTYRTANGPFSRTDQLMAVDGIGPATYERVADAVTTGE